ncbi:MAG: SdpI family protein [Patescibacteria group bacterium]
MSKLKIASIFFIVLSFGIGLYFYDQLPIQVASHWNSAGQVDGYMSRFWGTFLMPIISGILFLLLVFIPKFDPRKINSPEFKKAYDGFILLLTIYLFYIYLITLAWNLGYRFNFGQMLTPAMGILFFYVGRLLLKTKSNWFIGIRTPWTLSNDLVWDKTHQLGGRLFQISGLICLLGLLWPQQAIWLILIPILISSIFLIAYSYFEYKKLK